MFRPLIAFLATYPVVLPAAFHLTWLMGRGVLGHWPRPSVDDPKLLGTWVNVMHAGTTLLATAGLAAFVVGWGVVVLRAVSRPGERRRLTAVAVGTAMALLASILFLRWDPLSAVVWFAD